MFSAKRKPRKIGQDAEAGDTDINPLQDVEGDGETSKPLLKQLQGSDSTSRRRLTAYPAPSPAFKPLSKSKRKSAANRTSFGLGGTSMNDEDDGDSTAAAVFTPRKSVVNRTSHSKPTLRKSLAASIQSDQLSHRQPSDESRPSYSAAALNELKSSTPSTPKPADSQGTQPTTTEDSSNPSNQQSLDLASKFGTNLALNSLPSTIPTPAEILEKKARRARLAKEHDFISLDSPTRDSNSPPSASASNSDSDNEFKPRSLTRHANDYSNNNNNHPIHQDLSSRLAPDDANDDGDEDILVSDARLPLTRNAEKAARAERKADLRNLINDAEGGGSSASASDNDSDSAIDDRALTSAYERSQTRAALAGLPKSGQAAGAVPRRPRTPPQITALPSLAGVREKLEGRAERRRVELAGLEGRLAEVRREVADVGVRRGEVQGLLDEVGERLGRLQAGGGGKEDGERKDEVEREEEEGKQERERSVMEE